ncbi:MAG: GNAT family protein [bacterium]|jgi:ribosomal-protein-serine acetyltransferase
MTIDEVYGIRLRPLQRTSANMIFQAIDGSRNHLGKWLPFAHHTRSVSDTKRFISMVLDSSCEKKDEIFEIWYQKNFAGLVALKEIDKVNRKSEIGYWLTEEMTGKGIMTSACRLLVDHAFQKMGLNRITIKVASKNEKSKAIPLRLGFRFEGTEKEGELLNGRFTDLEVYGLLKSEWQ